jgi:hypothetical protein
MLAALAIAGAGISLQPDFIIADDVRAGRLVALLPGYMPPAININAAYPSRRHLSAKVRSFIEFLALRFARNPEWRLDAASTAAHPVTPRRAGRPDAASPATSPVASRRAGRRGPA